MRPFFLLRVVFVPTLSDDRSRRRATQGQPRHDKIAYCRKGKVLFCGAKRSGNGVASYALLLKPLKLLGIYAQPSLHSAGKTFAQLPFKAAERRRACKACFFCRRQGNLCAKPCILVRRRLSALCRGRRARRQSKSRENSRLFVFRFGRLF